MVPGDIWIVLAYYLSSCIPLYCVSRKTFIIKINFLNNLDILLLISELIAQYNSIFQC